jgi:hypothetical protein
MALDAFRLRQATVPLDPADEYRSLAALHADVAAWFEEQADRYEIVDHADRLFVETTLRGPARRSRAEAADRSVGLALAAAAAVIALAPVVRGRPPRAWLLTVAVPPAMLALLRPSWLRLLNRAWSAVGVVANEILTAVLLAMISTAS